MARKVREMWDGESRADTLCRMYGEAVTKGVAARMLNVTPPTIGHMMKDGRLTAACQGTRVDTRSIAAYIEAPEQAEEEGRRERVRQKYGCDYAV